MNSTIGIIPAAGAGSRIQPLAFSKELLPVGCRMDGDMERPKAVSEFLVERMILGGANRICFVIAPGKSDIMEYYGARLGPATFVYVVQPEPIGLCDSIFRAMPLVAPDDTVLIGLPDTIWYPDDGFQRMRADATSLLLFPVERPELFDAVEVDELGAVRRVQTKDPQPISPWVWGAMKMQAETLKRLHSVWAARGARDPYLGPVFNAFIETGGCVEGVFAGRAYIDTGTVHGYREAMKLVTETEDGLGSTKTSGAESRARCDLFRVPSEEIR